jgi:hypothetical protein
VRDVVLIAEDEQQPVLTRRKRQLRLGLRGAKVLNMLSLQVLIGWRLFLVDQQVMMARSRLLTTDGRDPHALEPEADDKGLGDGVAMHGCLWLESLNPTPL